MYKNAAPKYADDKNSIPLSLQKDSALFSKLTVAAYSESSWKSLANAKKSFDDCCAETKLSNVWPLTETAVTSYIDWAFYKKKLNSSTIKSYVSNLCTIHKLKNMKVDAFYSFSVKTAIKGTENLNFSIGKKPTRKAMTLPLLKILGHEIAKKNWSENTKIVVWATMTIAFFGSFRIGELLSKSENAFNNTDNLLWSDVKILVDGSIRMKNKVPKNRNPSGDFIDIFPFPGPCCPVSALLLLRNNLPIIQKTPVFKFANGKLLTQKNLNSIIVECLSPHFGIRAKNFSGHSFRAGLPSALASCHSLATEDAIKKWGRWKSDSYLKYTKLNHAAKKEIFSIFCQALKK